MKIIKFWIFFIGAFFLEARIDASMRRVTQTVTQKAIGPITQTSQQFATTQPKKFFNIPDFNVPDSYKFWKTKPSRVLEDGDFQGALALRHFAHTKAVGGNDVKIVSKESMKGALGSYDTITNTIELNNQDRCPAILYHTVLHEYRHKLQDINGSLKDSYGAYKFKNQLDKERKQLVSEAAGRKFYPDNVLNQAKKHGYNISWVADDYSSKAWLPSEYDAEYFAISHITCPTCLKINNVFAHINNRQGYFNQTDVEPFVQEAQHNACCPAHSLTPGDEDHNHVVKELEEALQQYANRSFIGKFIGKYFEERLVEKIAKLDKESGTLLQHIPEYNKDLIRQIAQYKEFQAMLGAKTLKELDVRKQMEQAGRDAQEGRYKALETSQEQANRQQAYVEPQRNQEI